MKNYYYFLGVSPRATAEEIKSAYRKLSLKYHPDRNVEDDSFFTDRFQELQEAYEVLGDPKRRREYDFQNQSPSQGNVNLERPPTIKTFEVNISHIHKGDEVILKWITSGADVVKIAPFGLMPPFGEKAFRVTGFKEGKFTVLLHATNTRLHKTDVRGLTIYEDGSHPFHPQPNYQRPSQDPTPQEEFYGPTVSRLNYFWLIFILMSILFITFSKCS